MANEGNDRRTPILTSIEDPATGDPTPVGRDYLQFPKNICDNK